MTDESILDAVRWSSGNAPSGALAGARVLELSQFIAGPVCGCVLADHGAHVIKLERPGGEDGRRIGPFVGGDSLYYATFNRNKSAITLHLKSSEGQEIYRRLIAETDIVVENYRPGVLDRLGLSHAAMSEINPRLITVSISGFGQSGPNKDVPAFDQIVQAVSGLMYLGGLEGLPPQKAGVSISDYAAGLQGAIGALLAFIAREKTGLGQLVDVALFDSLVFMLETAVATVHTTGVRPVRVGNGRPGSVPGNTYECADGWVYIAATSDRIWDRLLTVLDPEIVEELAGLASNEDRVRERAHVDAHLARWCSGLAVETVLELLAGAGVPSAPVRHVEELLTDPHVASRRTLELMSHPTLGDHVVPGVPVKLAATPGGIARRASRIGEDNDGVFGGLLGLREDEVQDLRDRGVI